jgi:hypothetical protein
MDCDIVDELFAGKRKNRGVRREVRSCGLREYMMAVSNLRETVRDRGG